MKPCELGHTDRGNCPNWNEALCVCPNLKKALETPEEVISGQLIRYVDSYQVGDGNHTLTTAIVAALEDAGYHFSR